MRKLRLWSHPSVESTVLFLIRLMDLQTLTVVFPLAQYVSLSNPSFPFFLTLKEGLDSESCEKVCRFVFGFIVCRFLEFTRWTTLMSQPLQMF